MREYLNETETLLAVGRVFSLNLSTEEAMRRVAREIAHAFQADMVGAYFLDAKKEALVPLAGYQVPKDLLPTLLKTPFPLSRFPFLQEAWKTRKPVWTSDCIRDPRFDHQYLAGVCRPQSLLFTPTLVRGEIVGGLFLVWWSTKRPFTGAELRLIEGVASQVGLALENAELVRQTQEKLRETETLLKENQRKVEELSVLYELSRAVTGQLDIAQLVQAIYRQVGRVLDAQNMGILLYDEGPEELDMALRMPEGRGDPEPVDRHGHPRGLVSLVVEHRQAIRTADYQQTCRREGVEPVPSALSFPHWLGVPMIAGDQTVGVLTLRSADRPFTEADERLLINIAGLAALALRNARLFEEKTEAYNALAAAQDQLIRTEKLRALGEMASGIAHDFNNLLASILGHAQLLLQHVEHPKLRRWLQLIDQAALDGAQTVRRIQELTRVRGDQPFVAVDLNLTAREALEVTRPRWRDEPQSRGISIQVETSLAQISPVAGDPVELRQAFTNLILNAVDAMPMGGTLSLGTYAIGDRVVLAVSDTGEGMSEEVQRRLFDPFFTTKGPQGTGLGLSMTFGIVTRHGGELAVTSAEGKGSTFRLSFPVNRAVPPARRVTVVPPTATSRRCLVVDDEPLVRQVLGDLLSQGGHEAVLAAEGTEAIERFKAEPFDLVITDLGMPGLNGFQLAQAIKEHDPTVSVFLVTGWEVPQSAEELKARGVDLVLVKPLKLGDILSAVAGSAPRSSPPGGSEA